MCQGIRRHRGSGYTPRRCAPLRTPAVSPRRVRWSALRLPWLRLPPAPAAPTPGLRLPALAGLALLPALLPPGSVRAALHFGGCPRSLRLPCHSPTVLGCFCPLPQTIRQSERKKQKSKKQQKIYKTAPLPHHFEQKKAKKKQKPKKAPSWRARGERPSHPQKTQ